MIYSLGFTVTSWTRYGIEKDKRIYGRIISITFIMKDQNYNLYHRIQETWWKRRWKIWV